LWGFQEVFGELNPEAVEKYFEPNSIEHNPLFEDGWAGIRDFISMFTGGNKCVFDIKRISAEGDLVWIHTKLHDTGKPGQFMNIMECFRLENGKIVEHWDAAQPMVEGQSKNTHPYF